MGEHTRGAGGREDKDVLHPLSGPGGADQNAHGFRRLIDSGAVRRFGQLLTEVNDYDSCDKCVEDAVPDVVSGLSDESDTSSA